MPVLKLTAVNSADAQLDDTINLNVLAMEAWLKLSKSYETITSFSYKLSIISYIFNPFRLLWYLSLSYNADLFHTNV